VRLVDGEPLPFTELGLGEVVVDLDGAANAIDEHLCRLVRTT
jgi:hypothetical protein